VLDRVARLVVRNGRVGSMAGATVTGVGIRPGMHGRAIIRVNHVAGGAAARAIVARMIVRAEKIQGRVEEASLLQADEKGVGAARDAEAGNAEPVRLLAALGTADLVEESAAALEEAKDIGRLCILITRQGVEKRQNALAANLLLRGWRNGLKT